MQIFYPKFRFPIKNSTDYVRGWFILGNTLTCPFCTGSGLTSIFNLPDDWKVEVKNEAYKTCSGWLRGANDCFAYKGFQVIKISPP